MNNLPPDTTTIPTSHAEAVSRLATQEICSMKTKTSFKLVVMGGGVLTIVVSAIIYLWFPDTSVPDQQWQLFNAKLGFLSIMVAVGWLQYEYFVRICTRIHDEVIPHLNSHRSQTGEAQHEPFHHPVWSEWLNLKWEQFDRRFPLLFGVVFTLLISVIVDWEKNATTDKHIFHNHPLLTALSQGSLMVVMFLFTTLLVFYLVSVNSDMKHFKAAINKIKAREHGL
jgi:hypothetical protein